jgi:hypothetical protein
MNRTAAKVSVAILLGWSISGCQVEGPRASGQSGQGDAPLEATLQTDRGSYRPGMPIRLQLTNTTPREVGYNLCMSRLERYDGDTSWVRVQQLGEYCTQELRTLKPRESASFVFRTEPAARAGEYRIVTDVHDLQVGTVVTLPSSRFRLARERPY